MSELKDLAWSVQEQVEPAPFDAIQRKGTKRRHRKQLLAAAGVGAATAVAILAVLLPTELRRSESPPVATQPNTSATAQPGPSREGEALIKSADATLDRFHYGTSASWMAGWSDCEPQPCRWAARLHRDGVSVATSVRNFAFTPVQYGDEVHAIALPQNKASGDPLMASLTNLGYQERPLRNVAATSTFGSGEVLIGAGELRVLNVANATLRPLRLPFNEVAHSPVQGPNNRWWIVSQAAGASTSTPWHISWTDDGGKSWKRHAVTDGHRPSRVAVSHDGQTVIATSWKDGATVEAIGSMVLSSDGGKTWRKVTGHPFARLAGPVAFGGGTGVIVGQGGELNAPPTAYRINSNGTAVKTDGWPQLRDDLAGDGKLLYGKSGPTSVAVSNNRGKDWQTVTPR
ncbi:WD40/YVTN/BNR-like repeat-containing protein [Kribbella deserti]|uniref:WD40/YVTN/BNR-like repeat-containing protein n=1 Tax=Kribbella deserti TaxID=1926257 RepID=A0ABV6QRQ2_9ACTN